MRACDSDNIINSSKKAHLRILICIFILSKGTSAADQAPSWKNISKELASRYGKKYHPDLVKKLEDQGLIAIPDDVSCICTIAGKAVAKRIMDVTKANPEHPYQEFLRFSTSPNI